MNSLKSWFSTVASNDATLLPDYRYQSPGVGAIDVSDPSAIEWQGYWQLDDLGRVSFLDANVTNVVIQEGSSPLAHIYDGVYEAGKPRSGYIRSWARALRTVGHRVFTLSLGELSVIDIRDTAQPELLATAPITTRQTSLAIAEPYVYTQVGCGAQLNLEGETYCTLAVFEVIDKDGTTELVELSQTAVGEDISDIAVGDGYSYIVKRDGRTLHPERLAVYDVRDSERPRFVKLLDLGDGVWAKRIAMRGELAYVATGTFNEDGDALATGLVILDIARVPDIAIVGSLHITFASPEPGFPGDRHGHVALSGNYVLYSSFEKVVHVVDVSDPTEPVEVQRIDVPAVVTDIDAALRQVYVVSKDGGMIVLRATSSSQPEPVRPLALYLPMAVS